MKRIKQILAVLLAVVMLLAVVPVEVNATSKTVDEAIQWIESKLGQYLDYDGAYGAQCVDLIMAYYAFLGVSPQYENGEGYSWNTLPSGWSRIQGATPQAGDILVYTGNTYGHVGIMGKDGAHYHQNLIISSYPDGSPVVKITSWAYTGITSPSYWGVVRPNFSGSSNSYYLDVNGTLDGNYVGNVSGMGTFDIYINGTKVGDDVTDYCEQHPSGTTYLVNDIKASNGKTYVGESSYSGTIGNDNVDVLLNYSTNSSDGDISSIINDLRSKFPHGKYWNHYVSNVSEAGDSLIANNDESFANSTSSYPCASHSETDISYYVGKYDCNYFDGGSQCCGFARKIFYDIHGVRQTSLEERTDTSNIAIGDYIDVGAYNSNGEWVPHYAVVVSRSGNTLGVAECNIQTSDGSGNCLIRWDHPYSVSQVHRFYHSDSIVHTNNTPGKPSLKNFKYYYPSGSTITLQWDPTVNTTQYNIWIKQYDNDQQQYVAIEWITKATSGLTRNLPDGRYQILLQSYNTNAWNSDHSDYLYTQSTVVFMIGEPVLMKTATSETNRYEFYEAPMTWTEAKAWCEAKGGHLVTITSAQEQSFVEGLISGANMNGVWIGASDTANEGTWEWVTGETFAYSNWDSGEPNNDGNEDYGCIYPHTGKWNDRMVDSEVSEKSFGIICEYEHLTHTYELTSSTPATCTEDGVSLYTCTVCGATKTETIEKLGHDYQVTEILSGTCITPEQVKYTCSRCGDVKIYDPVDWTEWSTMQPPTGDNYIVESKTQYRYKDKETEYGYDSSRSGWTVTPVDWEQTGTGSQDHAVSWPNGGGYSFDTSNSFYTLYNKAIDSEETDQWKRTIDSDETIGYVYYHWCRNEAQDGGPKNRVVGCEWEEGYDTFHAFYCTKAAADEIELRHFSGYSSAYVSAQPTVCMDSYYWSDYRVEIRRASYTDYRMKYQYTRWTDFSDWQDTAVTASDTRQVETRTVYRYKLKDQVPVAHVWDEGTVTTEPTCINEGVRTLTCT
ncbi:MAG: CHAP domain-containing protein, partial [Clostridia bacterium]|nr:CHAP domain-containing protein [Clostridia bacterium]